MFCGYGRINKKKTRSKHYKLKINYMKIDTKIKLKNLKDEVLKNSDGEILTLGMAISNILVSSEAGGKMKSFILAKKFFTDKNIDLDVVDLGLVKTIVEQTKIYNALVVGQIELLLSEEK